MHMFYDCVNMFCLLFSFVGGKFFWLVGWCFCGCFFAGGVLPSRVMAVASATVASGLTECGWLLLRSSHFQKKNDAEFTREV